MLAFSGKQMIPNKSENRKQPEEHMRNYDVKIAIFEALFYPTCSTKLEEWTAGFSSNYSR